MSVALPWESPPLPEWPAELPDHLSASQLGMLERCPEQYRRRYLLGEKEPPSATLVWGSVDGKAHGVNFTQKIESHEDISTADLQQAFATCMDEDVEERGGASEIDWRDDKPGDILDRGIWLASVYHEQVSPRVQPTGVEGKIELVIPGVAVPFIGYIDVDTDLYAIERKTAAAKSTEIPPQYRMQTLGYALARQRPVEVHISTRTKLPAVYTPAELPGLLLPFTEGLTLRAERMIRTRATLLLALFEKFGPDEPWPDGSGTMAWHMAVCDLCGYRPTCAWWQT